MLILSSEHLWNLMPPQELVATVEHAARAYDAGRAYVPERQHIEWNGNTLLTMPAAATIAVAVKLVSIVPANGHRGLPVTSGIMVLNDAQTGLPLALLNAAALTALRTGAVGALAMKYSTPAQTDSIGIVGCGVQGAWQAIFAHAVRPIRRIYCVRRSRPSFERFCATVRARIPQAEIVEYTDARELLARTQLVVAATTSSEPVLPDEPALLEGKHFISVGSFRPSMQELPDAVYRLAGTVVVDSSAAVHEVGDVIRCIASGAVQPADIVFIGQIAAGRRAIDIARTTVCKSVGMALYDLFAAHALYLAAKGSGIGQEISL